jgi:glycosyltransferase involved in cell wall biosynthesis
MVPRLDSGDAVSNMALAIHELLQSWGFESRIFATGMDELGEKYAAPDYVYQEFMGEKGDLLIYHFLIHCGNHRFYAGTENRKVLIYHNITPAEFYDRFYPEMAHLCRLGRELLPCLSDCDLALGVSEFNRRELLEAGFPEEKTGVLPINPPVDKLDGVEEDREFLRRLQDGKTNLLFVGRVVPNKRLEDVIKLFSCYHHGVNARSRLVFAGPIPINTYYAALLSLVEKLGLEGRVHFLGKVSDSRLKACYVGAHYYISMSEHEGFCVPLLEAFHFDVPVLAYAAGAVPETMGGAGVLFDRKDHPLLAEFLERLEKDALLRERILAAQRRRLGDFGREVFVKALREALSPFLSMEGERWERAAEGGG